MDNNLVFLHLNKKFILRLVVLKGQHFKFSCEDVYSWIPNMRLHILH
jgi:hypothetical protein